MLPQSDSANLLDHLIDLLAVRIAELLADRLKPPNGADLSRTVDRIERLLQTRGAAQPTAVASGGEADRKWGFPFAIDGVVGTEEARVLMGGCSERTLNRHVIAGKIRRGKDGKRAVYCHRSVMRYLAGLEE